MDSLPIPSPLRGRYLVTGASGRLGTALAARLTQAGAEVVLVGRTAAPLARARRTLDASAAAREAVCDVADAPAVLALADRLHRDGGPFDGIVHAAGQFASGRLFALDPLAVHGMLDTALLGAHWIAQAFLPSMVARGQGRLVLVAAAAVAPGRGAHPQGTSVPYLVAKSGLAVFGHALAAELEGTGVSVSVAYPPTFEDAARPGVLSATDVADALLTLLTPGTPVVAELVLAPGRAANGVGGRIDL